MRSFVRRRFDRARFDRARFDRARFDRARFDRARFSTQVRDLTGRALRASDVRRLLAEATGETGNAWRRGTKGQAWERRTEAWYGGGGGGGDVGASGTGAGGGGDVGAAGTGGGWGGAAGTGGGWGGGWGGGGGGGGSGGGWSEGGWAAGNGAPGTSSGSGGAPGTSSGSGTAGAPGTDIIAPKPSFPKLRPKCWDSGDNIYWETDEEFQSHLEPWHEAYEDSLQRLHKAQEHLKLAIEKGDVEWETGIMKTAYREWDIWDTKQGPLQAWIEEVRQAGSIRGLRPCPSVPSALQGTKEEAKEEEEEEAAEEEEIDPSYLADIAEAVGGGQSFYAKPTPKKRLPPSGPYFVRFCSFVRSFVPLRTIATDKCSFVRSLAIDFGPTSGMCFLRSAL